MQGAEQYVSPWGMQSYAPYMQQYAPSFAQWGGYQLPQAMP